MTTNIGVALILSAKNQASTVIDQFFSKTEAKMKAFGKGMAKIGEGIAEIYAAKKGLDMIKQTTDAYGDLESAQLRFKTNLMGPGGFYDKQMFTDINQGAKDMSAALTGSQAAYEDMVTIFMQNQTPVEMIRRNMKPGGFVYGAAELGVLMHAAPAPIGEFASHMIKDAGVKEKDIDKVLDAVNRLHEGGMGKTGDEAIEMLTGSFGKVALSMKNLGWQGYESFKQVGLLTTVFTNMGDKANMVGGNLRRMFDYTADTRNVAEVVSKAHQYGVNLKFNDKNGQSLGPKNFIEQLIKLHNLSIGKVQAILDPFTGGLGLETDFVKYLTRPDFMETWERTNKHFNNRANYHIQFRERMGGQQNQQDVLATNLANDKASFGSAISAPYKKVLDILNKTTVALGKFFDQHQGLSKMAAGLISVVSAGLALKAVFAVIRGVGLLTKVLGVTGPITMVINAYKSLKFAAIALQSGMVLKVLPALRVVGSAFMTFGAALLTNPLTYYVLAAVAVGAAVYFIYKNWGAISDWFKRQWTGLKETFMDGVNAVKTFLENFTPVGLIYKHWDSISAWVKSLGKKFYAAGVNIIHSIVKGIKDSINTARAAMSAVTTAMRAYLPFSPAKEGALRDIHKIKLMETIAAGIKPDAVVNKMHDTMRIIRRDAMNEWEKVNAVLRGDVKLKKSDIVHAYDNDDKKKEHLFTKESMHVTFAPVIHLNGGATAADGKIIADSVQEQFDKCMKRHLSNKERVRY